MALLILLAWVCTLVCWTGHMFYRETFNICFLIGSLFGLVGAIITIVSAIICY